MTKEPVQICIFDEMATSWQKVGEKICTTIDTIMAITTQQLGKNGII